MSKVCGAEHQALDLQKSHICTEGSRQASDFPNSSNNTDLSDLFCSSEAVFLKVIGQVQKGASLQIVAVTEDDQETLLLHTNQKDL